MLEHFRSESLWEGAAEPTSLSHSILQVQAFLSMFARHGPLP